LPPQGEPHKEDQTMKTKYTVALSMIAGAAIGALAIQGLHAQASKSRVFFITESDVVDQGSLGAYNAVIRPAVKAAGGDLVISEKITSVRQTGSRSDPRDGPGNQVRRSQGRRARNPATTRDCGLVRSKDSLSNGE
jgi:hypothetical protein